MRAACSQVKPGMTAAQLDRFVLDNRLDRSGANTLSTLHFRYRP
jgi:hypothetical protein